jgi:acetyl-CoA/propionyl-CoA carboxylase, biotin carboxylase, biotin carboxyl carrier protein
MELKFKEKIYNLEADLKPTGLILSIEGEKRELSFKEINDNYYLFSLNGKQIPVYISQDNIHIYINIEGNSFIFDKVNEEEKSFEIDSKSADKDIVKPPMPGSIVKIEVEKGQKVSEGDPLIIVEAMKMETTLYSSIDGIVTEVNVKASEQVDSDKVLMIIEKETTVI